MCREEELSDTELDVRLYGSLVDGVVVLLGQTYTLKEFEETMCALSRVRTAAAEVISGLELIAAAGSSGVVGCDDAGAGGVVRAADLGSGRPNAGAAEHRSVLHGPR